MKDMKCRATISSVLYVLCLFIILGGILSAEETGSLYLKKTAGDADIYYARAPRSHSEAQESQECLFRIASQLAIQKEVFVRFFDTKNEIESLIDYDQKNSFSIAEKLKVIQVKRTDDFVEILAQLTGKSSFESVDISISQRPSRDGNPDWVSDPPKSSRFFAAVGSFKIESNRADAFSNSDARAIAALGGKALKPLVSGNTKMHEGIISGAYIAQRWYNEKTSTYYSLALLPR